MFQLDLISNTISGSSGPAKSEAYQTGIDRLDELDNYRQRKKQYSRFLEKDHRKFKFRI